MAKKMNKDDHYTVWQSGKTDNIMREALIGQNSCTGMHTGLETEWFITLSRLIKPTFLCGVGNPTKT